MRRIMTTLALVALCGPVAADGITSYKVDGTFEDATFAVENAIIGRGLVIDYVSHVGAMLTRTAEDVGSDVELFEDADVFLFCSATASRSVIEAELMNIAYCPYGIFVADAGGDVMIGFRNFPEGAMQKIQDLLDSVAQEAAGK